jgi:uncharacterized protein (TIGR02145 family)
MNVKLSKTPPFTNPPNVIGQLERTNKHYLTFNNIFNKKSNMKQKITLLLISATILLSCGKKDQNNQNNNNQNIASVTDIDGNVYPTVTIGNQIWMAKNLAVNHYRNGDVIPNITDQTTWENTPLGAWCNYENNSAYGDIYGHLYNWYTINDPRNVAPVGWHVATRNDWQLLVVNLGGILGQDDSIAGGKMKEVGLAHWVAPNTGATNSSGFTSLPAGWLDGNGFYAMFEGTIWWAVDPITQNFVSKFAYSNGTGHSGAMPLMPMPNIGCSIRCVKD